MVARERAAGERRLHELAAAVDEARCIAAARAMAQRELELLNAEPRANRVDRHPHLAAEAGSRREAGNARGRRERALARERLARVEAGRAREPVRALRASRFRSLRPGARRNAAIVRSASTSSNGSRSPSRSASQRRSGPGSASRSASASAWPFPRRGSCTTRAPAPSATAAVPSHDPSSATTTSASGKAARSARTVASIDRSSSRAATRTVSRSATRARDERERRERLLGRLFEAVVAGGRSCEQEDDAKAAGRRVDVVDAGKPGSSVRAHGGVGGICGLDPDRGQAR